MTVLVLIIFMYVHTISPKAYSSNQDIVGKRVNIMFDIVFKIHCINVRLLHINQYKQNTCHLGMRVVLLMSTGIGDTC